MFSLILSFRNRGAASAASLNEKSFSRKNKMRVRTFVQRSLAIVLCATLLSPIFSLQVQAGDGPRIVIEIGQPGVWSLGQAHYLLEKMHRRNRKLSSRFPSEDDLDPNRISATRIDALRTSLGIEGQFDQAMGTQNSIALRRLSESDARRETARVDSQQKQAELAQTNNELAEINEKIAVLEEENRQSQEAREREKEPPPPSAEENQKRRELALLKVRKERKEEQRSELKNEITTLNTTSDTVPAAPTLQEPAFTTSAGSLPNPKTFNDFLDKALKEAGKPDLSASMKLNNFIQGQYEIIANQLTLLRDEVGPDDRVIFLELPASIYTVDKKSDNYVAQVEWTVTKYCDEAPPTHVQWEELNKELQKEGDSKKASKMLERIKNAQEPSAEGIVDRSSAVSYPITLDMIKRVKDKCKDATTERVRAIDIIPRQSALNVNEYHATVKETAILAAVKFLIGFAGKVSYQRQRELYEQFVQQQIFASGYGKGTNTFGWTYGPQPGTKRIMTGQKTTFAVLAVPRDTLALELKPSWKFYKRHTSPADTDDDVKRGGAAEPFFISVPGKRTLEYWVDGISYTPVKKGKRVTAVIEGNFFSPQLGVLVNGVPLEPVVSISRIASATEEPDVQSADGVAGEYEITSPRQIVLSFTMGDSYVGIPNITITSPEKTTPINFFDLDINHRGRDARLSDRTLKEPMFIEEFTEKLEIEPITEIAAVNGGNPVDLNGTVVPEDKQARLRLVRVKGAGLRPGGQISLNNNPIDYSDAYDNLEAILRAVKANPTPLRSFAVQESTRSYLVYAPDVSKWNIAYRHLTRQGYEEGGAAKDFSSPVFNVSVHNYRLLPRARYAEVALNVLSRRSPLVSVTLQDSPSRRCQPPILFNPAQKIYRVKCLVPVDNNARIERSTILIRAELDTGPVFADVALPVKPQVFTLFNPRTSKPEGFAAEEAVIVLSGVNLQGVTAVFFGTQKGEITGVSADSITVKAPKVTGVPKGEAVAVPIIIQTAADQIPSGAIYTYKGEPLAPNVIVWPVSPKEK
jgi:hypothetical protein